MGSFNSAQIAGIYILGTLSQIINLDNIGIYWDYGLISIPQSYGPLNIKNTKERESI